MFVSHDNYVTLHITLLTLNIMRRLILFISLLCGLTVHAEDYGFWVGSVKVTSDNCSNISGGSIKGGLIKYNATDKILSIHSATITGTGSGGDVIHNKNCEGLTIVFYGKNNFSAKDIEAVNCEKNTTFIVKSGETWIETYNKNKPAFLLKNVKCDIYVHDGGSMNISSAGYGFYGNVDGKRTSRLSLYGGQIYVDASRGAVSNLEYLFFSELWDTPCDVRFDYTDDKNYPIVNNLTELYGPKRYSEAKDKPVVITSPTSAFFDKNSGTIRDSNGTAIYKQPIDFSNNYGAILNNVNFPDAAFRKIMFDKFGPDTIVSTKKVEECKALDVWGKKIASLDGIQFFSNLETLNFSLNKVQKFDYNLPVLRILECYGNQLSSLSLDKLPMLYSLTCPSNRLTSLDLTEKIVLEYLDCQDNMITELPHLDYQKYSLKYLSCGGNKLTKLDLRNAQDLESLSCDNSELLTTLYILGTPRLKELTLYNVPKLENLMCSNTGLENINLACEGLKTIYIDNNEMKKIDLKSLPSLTNLTISNTKIEQLDMSENVLLKRITLDFNKLKSVKLPQNETLYYLSCCCNMLKGGAMDALVTSLPDLTNAGFTGTLRVNYPSEFVEGNVFTKKHAKEANAKKWYAYSYAGESLMEPYSGVPVKGDFDDNDEVNTTDVTMLYNVMFGTYDPKDKIIFDLNFDSEINTTDVTKLYNIMFGTDE